MTILQLAFYYPPHWQNLYVDAHQLFSNWEKLLLTYSTLEGTSPQFHHRNGTNPVSEELCPFIINMRWQSRNLVMPKKKLNPWGLSESTLLSNYLGFTKEHCLLTGSPASPVSPSRNHTDEGKYGAWMKLYWQGMWDQTRASGVRGRRD
jgi:hypothetical protein